MDDLYLEELRLRRRFLFRLLKGFDFDAPCLTERNQISDLVSDPSVGWSVRDFHAPHHSLSDRVA